MPQLDLVVIIGAGILIVDGCWQFFKRNAK